MAVSRNALVNTFNDGMNKDLNPILTPNTVMTDCLNGTIVTYNGNEFALQNDLGNYKFKHGELSDGFVPIGMKEHANILYIISYNPIEDKVEIGSFPSMKNIENGLDKTCTPKELNTLDIKENKNYNYTDESKNFDLTFLSELGDDYILNPGDKYKLIDENKENHWYITKSYYIMSENNQLYDITSVVEVSDQENDFKHVSWNVPGHMCCKYDIIHPSEFNAYVIKRDGKIRLKIQAFFNYKEMPKDFPLYFNIGKEDGSYTHNTNWSLSKSPKYNDLFIVYSGEFDWPDDDNDTITICPEIYVGDNSYIVFDQFKTEVKKEIEEFDPGKVHIADTLFKYYVGKSGLTLSLNIDSNPGCKAYYNLKRHVDPSFKVMGENPFSGNSIEKIESCRVFNEYQEIPDLNINGQNVFNIKFSTKDHYENNKYKYVVNGFNKNNSLILNKNNIKVDSEVVDGVTNYFILDSNIGKAKVNDFSEDRNYIAIENTFDKEDIYILEIIVIPENVDPNSDEFEIDKIKHKIYTNTIYVTEYINMYRNLYDNYVGDFTLDEAAFVEAVEHEMKTVELFSKFEKEDNLVYYALKDGVKYPFEFNNDKDDITLDNGDKLYEDFINKEIGSETPHTNIDFSVNYGVRYSANLSKTEFIKYNKNQYNNVGRLWRMCTPENINIYCSSNGKNEPLNVIENDLSCKISFDISSSIDLLSENNSIAKITSASSSKLMDMDYSIISKLEETIDDKKFTWNRIDTIIDVVNTNRNLGPWWVYGTTKFNNRPIFGFDKTDDSNYIFIKWGSSGDDGNDYYNTCIPNKNSWYVGSKGETEHPMEWIIKLDDLNNYQHYDHITDEGLKSMCDFLVSTSLITNIYDNWTDGSGDKTVTMLDRLNENVKYPMLCMYFSQNQNGTQDQFEIKKLNGNFATKGKGAFYSSNFLYDNKIGDLSIFDGNRWFFSILLPSIDDGKPCLLLPNFQYSWNGEINGNQLDTALYICKCIIYYCVLLECAKYCYKTKNSIFNYITWRTSNNYVYNKYIKNIESHYNLKWIYPSIKNIDSESKINDIDLSNIDIVCTEDVGKRKTGESSSEIIYLITNFINKYNTLSLEAKNMKDVEPEIESRKFFIDSTYLNNDNIAYMNNIVKDLLMNSGGKICVPREDVIDNSGIFSQTDADEFNNQFGFMHRYSFEDN